MIDSWFDSRFAIEIGFSWFDSILYKILYLLYYVKYRVVCTYSGLTCLHQLKVLGVLRAGQHFVFQGFSSRRAGTAPSTGFLWVLSMLKAVAKDSTWSSVSLWVLLEPNVDGPVSSWSEAEVENEFEIHVSRRLHIFISRNRRFAFRSELERRKVAVIVGL